MDNEKIKIEIGLLAASTIFYALRNIRCTECPFELMCKESGCRNVSVCEAVMSQITAGNLSRLEQNEEPADEEPG